MHRAAEHQGTWGQLQPSSLRTLQAPASHFPLSKVSTGINFHLANFKILFHLPELWEKKLLKWNPLTSVRTPFGYLATKNLVLNRAEHTLAMVCIHAHEYMYHRGPSCRPTLDTWVQHVCGTLNLMCVYENSESTLAMYKKRARPEL